jgi:hypothetical protein
MLAGMRVKLSRWRGRSAAAATLVGIASAMQYRIQAAGTGVWRSGSCVPQAFADP